MQRLNLKQMAAEFGKTEKTFRKYVKKYAIPHARFGRGYAFNPVRVEQHLEELTRLNAEPNVDLTANYGKKKALRNKSGRIRKISKEIILSISTT